MRLFTFLIACLQASFCAVASSVPVIESPTVPPVDCTALASFLEDEVMALSYTASFGGSCITIESTVYFDANGTATHWAIVKASATSRLLATGTLDASQVVTSGNPFTLTALAVGVPDAE